MKVYENEASNFQIEFERKLLDVCLVFLNGRLRANLENRHTF